VSYITVSRSSELQTLLRHLESSPWIALDTEFISERKYRSQLCLIQIAAEGILAIIDPMALKDTAPFWEFLCEHDHETIVHAFRSEMEFCFRYTKQTPKNLFDVQLAAGLIGTDYPCSFGGLLAQHIQVSLQKEETRTNWAKRPLSQRQVDYALNDVRYLSMLSRKIKKKLQILGRMDWYRAEMDAHLQNLIQEWEAPRWRQISGIANLDPREMAIAGELWIWRDRRAALADIPVAYILRDDLIIELARRKSPDPKRITAIRGMQRSDIAKQMSEISAAITRGLDCPESELPKRQEKPQFSQYTQMVQLIHSGLAMLCRQQHLAPSIVVTPLDIRELLAFRLGFVSANGSSVATPRLITGWRAEVVGDFLEDFLEGRTAIRFDKTHPQEPLQFVRYEQNADFRL